MKAAGVDRIHANLETSRRYFPHICTTHTYQDKVDNIRRAQAAGLDVCSGGILGMGETWEDRIDMALDLAALGIGSIPLNILRPIPGTPFGDLEPITNEEVLRAVAIFRYLNPTAWIRMAAGRGQFSGGGAELSCSGPTRPSPGICSPPPGPAWRGTRPCSGPWAISCDKPERRRNYDAGSDDLRRGWTEEQDVCPGDDRPDGGGDLCAGPHGPSPSGRAHLLTNLAIYLSLYLLGWKWGTASYVVYMLIGMVGVPVFSGFTGGLGKLAGPHRRLHHRLCAHGGAGWTGDRPLPEPGGPVRGNGRSHGGVLRLRYGVVLPLHGQHGVRPHWACACSPSSPEMRSRCCWP